MGQMLPAEERRMVPWRNGGGTTADVDRAPCADVESFDWRVSLAKIDQAGSFSIYPNVDRILMPVGDSAILLNVSGAESLLPPTSQLSFGGEDAVSVRLPDGPAMALNVMVRRGSASASMTLLTKGRSHAPIPQGANVLVIALSDTASVWDENRDETIRLGRLDALRFDAPHRIALTHGLAAAVVLRQSPLAVLTEDVDA